MSDTSPHAGDQPTPDTLKAAYRDLLDTARAFKRERDANRRHLDRLASAADRYLSASSDNRAERLFQLDDEMMAAQRHLERPQHDDEAVGRSLHARWMTDRSWEVTTDRTARTEPGRAAFRLTFERRVDPEGVLDPEVRAQLAEEARLEHYRELSRRGVAARQARRAAR